MKKIIIFFMSVIFCTPISAASLVGTETEKNILTAVLGEALARDKYDWFASVANSEGLQSIGKIFTETANMEKEHGQRFYGFIESADNLPSINKNFDFGKMGSTADNLRNAIANESEENSHMYISMANTARAEGFDEIADDFEKIAAAEKYHQTRYATILLNLENKTFFSKAEPVRWKCTNCGYHTTAPGAPNKCPACEHPIGYFIEVREEYF